jgi:hypothetical protein
MTGWLDAHHEWDAIDEYLETVEKGRTVDAVRERNATGRRVGDCRRKKSGAGREEVHHLPNVARTVVRQQDGVGELQNAWPLKWSNVFTNYARDYVTNDLRNFRQLFRTRPFYFGAGDIAYFHGTISRDQLTG